MGAREPCRRQHIDGINRFCLHGVDRIDDFFVGPCRKQRNLNTQIAGGAFERVWTSDFVRISKDTDTLCIWHRLMKQLKALKVELKSKHRHTRHVSFGMAHRSNEPAGSEIVGHCHDRYAAGCTLHGVRGRCPYCEDYTGACAHQLVSHCIQSRLAEAMEIDLKIGALYKAVGRKFLKKAAPIWPPMYIGQNSIISQNPDARGPPGFVR